jgi:hypothetical protein
MLLSSSSLSFDFETSLSPPPFRSFTRSLSCTGRWFVAERGMLLGSLASDVSSDYIFSWLHIFCRTCRASSSTGTCSRSRLPSLITEFVL